MSAPPLAFHLLPNSSASDVARALQGAPAGTLLKACDAKLIAVAKGLGARVLFRPYLNGDDGPTPDGAAWANAVIAAIRAVGAPWPDIVQFRNELDAADPLQVAESYLAYRRTLSAAGYPGLVGLGSYGTGWPDWPQYRTLLATRPDCLLLDEYWGRTVAGSPDLALRHVDAIARGLIPANLPIYITECGADDCGDGKGTRGWQQKLDAMEQVANLAAYRAGCAPSVVCAFVFADGGNDPAWNSYRTFGTPVEAAIRATWQGNGPQQAQDAPGSPIAVKEASLTTVGCDLSNVNGAVDMAQVATAARFVCLKLSEGVGWRDPTFTANWDAAGAAGLVRCAYHFARPDLQNTPEAEAGYFVRQLPPLAVGDSLALDLEVGNGDLSGWALRWLQAVQQAVGFAPWLYSYPDFIQTRSLGTVALAAYPLWYASYQASEPAPPGQWRQIAVWQATDARAVPGVAAPVDGDVTDLTVEQLKALGKPAPVAVTTGGSLDALAQEALAYYTQTGVKVDPTHGVFLHAMLPLYALWKQMAADPSPACAPDLIKPGPLVLPEYGSLFGGNRPAACVKLSNAVIGVFQSADGSWNNPFRASI